MRIKNVIPHAVIEVYSRMYKKIKNILYLKFGLIVVDLYCFIIVIDYYIIIINNEVELIS